ncbi:hypothetical protein D3C72_1919740 [compost metagenome]
MRVQGVQRKALAGQVIVDAGHHQRRAVAFLAGAQFFRAHPHRTHDAGIELAARVERAQVAGKGKAHVGHIRAGARRQRAAHVAAQQRARLKGVRGFFQRLADDGADQAFARVQVARGLVQAQPVCGFFFDQQEAAAAFDHGGNGHTGIPVT